ncbi:MAG: class I SAM-dependent methyltransferase [Candidatus Omnitrophica bacterium]|nr:class I SAM-dependent methyltransferase [Candidatus Omnitrophota bacterium]MBU1995922.1 class I SAM-dependent methyltransferase [Candidatus Omnitrophota bacterium]MBU4333748.1 class I SAM-dependent methyltransferase [Candidatus Omnitrophota bacterium]
MVQAKAPDHTGVILGEVPRSFYIQHFKTYTLCAGHVKDKRVLEIGFGYGYGTEYIADFAKEIYAIDLMEEKVRTVSEKSTKSNVKFMQMDGADLKFEDRSFDVVLAFHLIEHIPRAEHDLFLEGIKRVLRDDGKFIVLTPNVLKMIKKDQVYEKNPYHDLEFTYELFEELLTKHFSHVDMNVVDFSFKHKMIIALKRMGIFKSFPKRFNIVARFLDNIDVKEYVMKKKNIKMAHDLFAICSK